MPATVKTTGPATKAIAIVAVIDGVITELVNGWTDGAGLTIDPAVTTGTDDFDGTALPYFETLAESGSMQGVSFDVNPLFTARVSNKGFAGFVACSRAAFAAPSQPSYPIHLQRDGVTTIGTSEGFGLVAGTTPPHLAVRIGGFDRAETGDTIVNDGATAFVAGWQYMTAGTDAGTGYGAGGQVYYGEDTDDPALTNFQPASPVGGGFQPAGQLKVTGVGGVFEPDDASPGTPGDPQNSNAAPARYIVWAIFDDLLSVEEYRALHADPLGTLLDITAPANATINSQAGVYQDGQIDVVADVSNATAVTAQLKVGGVDVGTPVAMTNVAGTTWTAQFGDAAGSRLAFLTGTQNYTVDLVATPGDVPATATLSPVTMISVSGQPKVNRTLAGPTAAQFVAGSPAILDLQATRFVHRAATDVPTHARTQITTVDPNSVEFDPVTDIINKNHEQSFDHGVEPDPHIQVVTGLTPGTQYWTRMQIWGEDPGNPDNAVATPTESTWEAFATPALSAGWFANPVALSGNPVHAALPTLNYLETATSARNSAATIQRVSDNATWDTGSDNMHRPMYATRAAWNSDDSKVLFQSGVSGGSTRFALLNDNGTFDKLLPGLSTSSRWRIGHPTKLLVVGSAAQVKEYDTATTSESVLFNISGYSEAYANLSFGEGEGQDNSGTYLTMALRENGTNRWGVAVVNLDTQAVVQFIPSTETNINTYIADVNHFTMSASGAYILTQTIVAWTHPTEGTVPVGLNVWDRSTGALLRTYTNGTAGTRHLCNAVDASGNDVAVMVGTAVEFVNQVFTWRLDTGATQLQYAGPVSGNYHVGPARNKPGWAFLASHGDDATSHVQADPGWDHLLMISLDGSNTVVPAFNIGHPTGDEPAHNYWQGTFCSMRNDGLAAAFQSGMDRSGYPATLHAYIARSA